MKEITSIVTAQITQIVTLDDAEAEEIAACGSDKNLLAEALKKVNDADDVIIKNSKTFVREVDE